MFTRRFLPCILQRTLHSCTKLTDQPESACNVDQWKLLHRGPAREKVKLDYIEGHPLHTKLTIEKDNETNLKSTVKRCFHSWVVFSCCVVYVRGINSHKPAKTSFATLSVALSFALSESQIVNLHSGNPASLLTRQKGSRVPRVVKTGHWIVRRNHCTQCNECQPAQQFL